MTGTRPELAVVVLSVGAPPELKTALESLKDQSVPLEIVVVNSGGGDVRARLPAEMDIKVLSAPGRLWPGAARNVGIRATEAPWVAFMASDHVATHDWAAARLALHRQGHRAVACAMINNRPRNLYALAGHLAILVRRLPGTPPRQALLYGVSYARELFDQHGEFREDLRIGEDTDFNTRLSGVDRPVWAPQVQTVHSSPATFRRMTRSQYARGRRSGLHWPEWSKVSLPTHMYRRFRSIVRLSWAASRGMDRAFVVGCWPFLMVCVCAYGLGVRDGRQAQVNGEGEGKREPARVFFDNSRS
jgi:GT2 family glycosyltransferase